MIGMCRISCDQRSTERMVAQEFSCGRYFVRLVCNRLLVQRDLFANVISIQLRFGWRIWCDGSAQDFPIDSDVRVVHINATRFCPDACHGFQIARFNVLEEIA